MQKISDLHLDSQQVQTLITQRWQRDPECKARGYDFKQCQRLILDRELVTPASIAADPQFVPIYSNYPPR